MSEQDSFEALVAANPTRARAESLPGDEALLARILATDPNRSDPPTARPRKRAWVLVGVSATVALMAAFAVLRHEAPTDPTQISCLSDVSVSPHRQIGLPTSDDPVAACRQLWQAGEFGDVNVPALTACITDQGRIAVVPGGNQSCIDLGYSLWNGSLAESDDDLITFQVDLARELMENCSSREEAADDVQDLLTQHGLEEWTIAFSDNWTADMPCTKPAVDPQSKTVTLSALPRTKDGSG
ncbi:MAG: hypothetical protein K8R99_01145 [Actinomycetia bacterium]|nr:hypothetical protein [Actinomycetes bacterium]